MENINIRKKVETILYKVLKRAIERGNYNSKEEMAEKLSVLYTADQLTKEEYLELMEMLEV